MRELRQIQRPQTIEEAVKFLAAPGAVALAGGTQLVAEAPRTVRAVVDLSALGLDYVRESQGAIAIGATTPLASLDESPILRALSGGVLAQAAHRSAASVLRNQGSLAGTLITDPSGILAVALLALRAEVHLFRERTQAVALADFFAGAHGMLKGTLVTEVVVPMGNPRCYLETVARTPSDRPIVSACAAAQIEGGRARGVRIALGGVADYAVRANAAERALEGHTLNAALVESASRAAIQGLAPRGDFRGSAEYRKQMAVVLTRRAIEGFAA